MRSKNLLTKLSVFPLDVFLACCGEMIIFHIFEEKVGLLLLFKTVCPWLKQL